MINGLDRNVKTPSYFLQRSIEIARGAPHIGIFGKSGILVQPAGPPTQGLGGIGTAQTKQIITLCSLGYSERSILFVICLKFSGILDFGGPITSMRYHPPLI